MDGYLLSEAEISLCGKFRYSLLRQWDASLPVLLFIMLNPSTAAAGLDDPTIRRCVGFAKRMGYGSIEVVNLYAYRATNPLDLKAAGYPIGDQNDLTIISTAAATVDSGGKVVAAWGAWAQMSRALEIRRMLDRWGIPLHEFDFTKHGHPRHPLMLPYSAQLSEWVFA